VYKNDTVQNTNAGDLEDGAFRTYRGKKEIGSFLHQQDASRLPVDADAATAPLRLFSAARKFIFAIKYFEIPQTSQSFKVAS
jgi:hypothetical protein